MKGMEFKMILGLIILIAVILLIVLIVINPALIFGETTETQIEFREACIFWSLNAYKGTSYEYEENIVEMGPHCANALHVLVVTTAEDWERCRDICRAII